MASPGRLWKGADLAWEDTADGGRWMPSPLGLVELELTEQAKGMAPQLRLGEETVLLSEINSVDCLGAVLIIFLAAASKGFRLENGPAQALEARDAIRKAKADAERMEGFDKAAVSTYFDYYSKLANQENMLQDGYRTGQYKKSIAMNPSDFQGKVVMDVGAGSGILSYFAAQAGASKVFAVEASSMASAIEQIAARNDFGPSVCVVGKTLESIRDEVAPNSVDILVSEPIGTFLFNERMIETYIYARDHFLKPGGKMFPSSSDLVIAPFSDNTLYWEQGCKATFWSNKSFYGVDLSAAVGRVLEEELSQPIVDYINPECLVSKPLKVKYDFYTVKRSELEDIKLPFKFQITQPCLVHGIAGWFDAFFEGTDKTIVLSTAPWNPGTHWYQIRFLFKSPLAVNAGQWIDGHVHMEANKSQSYFIRIEAGLTGSTIRTASQKINLRDPKYRFFSSQNVYIPQTHYDYHNDDQPSVEQPEIDKTPPPFPPRPQGMFSAQGAQALGYPAAQGTFHMQGHSQGNTQQPQQQLFENQGVQGTQIGGFGAAGGYWGANGQAGGQVMQSGMGQ